MLRGGGDASGAPYWAIRLAMGREAPYWAIKLAVGREGRFALLRARPTLAAGQRLGG